MTLGETIRKAREQSDWTQARLAEAVGVTPSYITKLEKGEALPSYDRLLALARVLLLPSEQLLALMEHARGERAERRIYVRGIHVRGAYGVSGGNQPGASAAGEVGVTAEAEQLGREILGDPDLRTAVMCLRAALADAGLKAAVLMTLEAFAQRANAGPQEPARRGRKARQDEGKK
jgi:transcriptional regulator with XRE-family HTH domain